MFRRRRTEKMLSADELKTKLYSHLDKTGSINRIRVEIREKLISELLKKAAPAETVDVANPIYTFDRTVLPLQISNWLIYDHLLRQGYQYALSIFVTEANFPTHPEKLLAACDILILLGLDSTSPEYKSITQMCSTSNAQLTHSLLVAVIKCLFDLTTREGRFSETKEAQVEVEHKVLERERTLDSEPAEFKEPSRILKQKKGSVDLSLHDQVLLIKEEKEKEVQQLRHKLLQELDRLHSQERKQQLEMEQLHNELQSEKDDLFSEKEKLRLKELLMDKEYENKLEKKTRELETGFIFKMHSKEKEQEILQQQLHEKEQKLNLLEVNLSNQKESCITLKKELEDIKHIHSTVQTKYSNLLDENTNLLKKFESMSDYAVLKGDLETKTRDLKNLQLEFEEYCKQTEKEKVSFRENLQKLDTKLRIKEPELLEAQKQLNLARDTLHMEESLWLKERRKLEQEVMTSREMYQTLIQRIEEQKEDIQALHRTIHILHYQITDKNARNTARVEPFIPSRSSLRVTDISNKQPEIFRLNRGTDDSPSKYRQKSLKFIEDAKDRITKLQLEADALQYKSSVVYSSAPKMTTHVTSNPSLFNFTSEQRFQPSTSHAVKPFVSELPSTNFENLIRNELPTLDLSFPAHIKSQLANAYANVYKSGLPINTVATEMKTPNAFDEMTNHPENVSKKSKTHFTLQSGTSPSVKNQQNMNTGLFRGDRETNQYDLNRNNNSQVLPGESFLEESSLSNTRIPATSSAVKDYQNIKTGLFIDGKATNQYDLNKSNSSKILPSESFLEESSSCNIQLSSTMTPNIQRNDNPDISPIKTGGGDTFSEDNGKIAKSLPKNSFQENSNPTHVRNLNRSLNEVSENTLGTPTQLENVDKASESDIKKPTSSDQKDSYETPLVVDLDAAWKRKSSLKSPILTPLHRKPLTEIISTETDNAQTSSSQLQSIAQDIFTSSLNKSNLSGNFNDTNLSDRLGDQSKELQRSLQKYNKKDPKFSGNINEADSSLRMGHDSVEQQKGGQESNNEASKLFDNSQETDSIHRIRHNSIEPLSSVQEPNNEAAKLSKNHHETDSSHRIDHHSMEPQSSAQESNSGASKRPVTEPQVEKTKEPPSDKVETVNPNIPKPLDSGDEQKKILSDSKPVHEDSLSELSEIHLSCGSEQEQQKEDSDNW